MRVVKNGKLVGQVLTCDACQCEFEIQSGDRPDEVMMAMGGPVAVVYDCPQCRNGVMFRIPKEGTDGA